MIRLGLRAVPGYLQRIEDLAARLARYNLLLDADTRTDIEYIQLYAAAARVEVTQTIQELDGLGGSDKIP